VHRPLLLQHLNCFVYRAIVALSIHRLCLHPGSDGTPTPSGVLLPISLDKL
jgi:hypothetical protein